MDAAHPTLTLTLALAAGVLAQSLARHLRVPGIVLLLVAGVALGPDGLGWVQPRELGDGLYAIVDMAVAVILFEGGLNLQVSRLWREQASIRRLITWGALITMTGGAVAARYLLDWSWEAAVLFGSLVVVTGPTVVGPIVRELRLKPRLATVLEAEGVLIDPIGAILAALVLELVLSPNVDSVAAGGLGLVMRLGFGVTAGALTGLTLGWLLRIKRLVPEGFENILALATVLLLFEGSEAIVRHSGILAVTSAGVMVGNLRTLADRDLREFKDQLSIMLIGLLFVMLAADVRYEHVLALGWPGLMVVGALVVVVRPVCVFIATLGSDLSTRERAFVAMMAPRGIVAAAVASIVAGSLEREGIAGGLELRALVFLTIAGTVVLTGLTAGFTSLWLGVRLPGRDGVAILNVASLGLALGEALRAKGTPVVFIDSNPQSIRRAEEVGFGVVFGNALEERTMQRARFESVETAIALTGNQTVNGVFVSRAQDLFGVPHGLVATSATGGLVGEMMKRGAADVVFDGRHDVQRWDVRSRRGDVEIVRRRYWPDDIEEPESDSDSGESQVSGERYVILCLERGDRVLPMRMSLAPRKGDVATVAIHGPERDDALRLLEASGWLAVTESGEEEGESADGAEAPPGASSPG